MCIVQYMAISIYSFKTEWHFMHWPRGLMDKASDFESEDCEFESRRGRPMLFLDKLPASFFHRAILYLRFIKHAVPAQLYCSSKDGRQGKG